MNKLLPHLHNLNRVQRAANSNLQRSLSTNMFSQVKKIDILKTYLQIIPPHEIHQIVQKKQKKLQTLIKSAYHINSLKANMTHQSSLPQAFANMGNNTQQIIEQQQQQQQQQTKVFKQIYKYIKNKSPYVQTSTLSKVIEVVSQSNSSDKVTQESKDVQVYKRKTYLKIVREFKYKSQMLPLQDVVDFVYKLAKLNIKEYQVMKAAENVIIEEVIKINYPMIRKILWAFTHLDVGSTVLYSHVSKTIKVGQFQLEPLQLAESAYMLSKVSQNAKGGYGVFQIAQKHIQTNLARMNFDQLAKASYYMLTQNIGSNAFQLKLQAQIYKKYPSKDKLPIADFVMLLKATSAYYFKFNDKALFNMLKTSTMRQARNSSLEQFQDVVWSWGRLGKGDSQLWQCLQSQVKRRVQYLKARQISFIYNSISSSAHADQSVLELLQQKFLSLANQKTNQHYYIKILLGMQKQKKYNKQSFLAISQAICKRIHNLSKSQLISFLKVLNESDYDYMNKHQIQSIIDSLNQAGTKKLLKTIYTLKISEISQILYTYIKFQINNKELINQCFSSLSEVMSIPKGSFVKALFSFTIRDNYEKAYKMVIILQQLLQYGPIGYFFSPYEFPLMAYSVLHLYYHSKGSLDMNPQLIRQVKATLKQINPVILNDFVRKAYDQAIKITEQNKTKNLSKIRPTDGEE